MSTWEYFARGERREISASASFGQLPTRPVTPLRTGLIHRSPRLIILNPDHGALAAESASAGVMVLGPPRA